MSSSFEGTPNNFIRENYIFPEDDPPEHDVKLREYLTDISLAVNSKDSGLYTNDEVVTGQRFLPLHSTEASSSVVYRDVYRKVIDFGALPNTTTKTVAHGISTTQDYSIVQLYGAATNPAAAAIHRGIPIPYVNALTPIDSVGLFMDATNISITTTSAIYIGYTRCFVIVEYIKVV